MWVTLYSRGTGDSGVEFHSHLVPALERRDLEVGLRPDGVRPDQVSPDPIQRQRLDERIPSVLDDHGLVFPIVLPLDEMIKNAKTSVNVVFMLT